MHQVLRYPLSAAGVPAQEPDATLKVGDPGGVAIAPDGRLYVVERSRHELLIFDPAPESAAKPARVVRLGHAEGLGAVAIDPLGFAYAGWMAACSTGDSTCGYADAFAPYSQATRKIGTLAFAAGPPSGEVRAMTVNGSQSMIEQSQMQDPAIVANVPRPAKGAIPYLLTCGAADDAANAWGAQREIFEADLGATQPATPPRVVVIPDFLKGKSEHCPESYAIWSSTVPIERPLAIAVHGNLIYVSTAFDARLGSAAVLVLNPAKRGAQAPVAVLGSEASPLREIAGLAIGP